MEESHYALHIALQTLKERCQQFQSRISTLEEENVNLRLECCENTPTNDSSFGQIDGLKRQVTKLTEQKGQLSKSVAMVTAENRKLWTRLSKLTQRNETIGSKLNKINDSLSQHSPAPALIRSKTFTQESPQNKFLLKANYDVVDESDKISLELEDISLKLISSIAKEKLELEQQCSEMVEMQSNEGLISNSFTFGYVGDDVDNTVVEDMELHLGDLKSIKELLATEHRKLLKNLSNLATVKALSNPVKDTSSKIVQTETNEVCLDLNESEELEELRKWGTPEASLQITEPPRDDDDRICPICNKRYDAQTAFDEFQTHVENHFTEEAALTNGSEN